MPMVRGAKVSFCAGEAGGGAKGAGGAGGVGRGYGQAVCRGALCSNLARGCEKQYQEPEAALFKELADFFAAATPLEPGAELGRLAELFQEDLTAGYPALRAAAQAAEDRGTLRICVWGEKVTNILYALAQRYQKEGEAFLANTQVWVCTVCGFVYVGDAAPALCPVCKVPAWKFEKIEGRG